MSAYYNEIDPYAAQWLRNLIAAGHLPLGEVDERSIVDVNATDLEGFTQCHFFAGIGGWPHALRLAGWPDDREVWTCSCPCQPLSSAGQQKGHVDERHLWPAFFRLVPERRPPTIFGEQVASKLGFEWLAGIRADLEDARYACGAADLCSPCVRAPHIRQRIFWMAHALEGRRRERQRPIRAPRGESDLGRRGAYGGVADTLLAGAGRDARAIPGAEGEGEGEGCKARHQESRSQHAGANGFWDRYDLIPCSDGKARRIEPGTFPLAHGVPNRVGQLRAYGNAINPILAAEFIKACEEAWA